MDLPAELVLLEHMSRLKIMALMYRRADVGVKEAREALSMTPGNFDSHVQRLESAGWVQKRESLMRTGFKHRLRLTKAGGTAFVQYLDCVRLFLEQSQTR